MRIYVAGPSAIEPACHKLIQALVAAGVTITHDWTAEIRAHVAKHETTSCRTLDEPEKTRIAITDIAAVKSAEMVVLVYDDEVKMLGSWVELGAALGLGIPVLVAVWNESGTQPGNHTLPLWLHHPGVTVHRSLDWPGDVVSCVLAERWVRGKWNQPKELR